MNVIYQIEPSSTDRLLSCLDLAIEEAKLVKMLIETKSIVDRLKIEERSSNSQMNLDRNIDILEKKLADIRGQASKRLTD